MVDASRPADFGQLLLDRGLVSPEELTEAIHRQRQCQIAGRDPLPRLGELFVEMGVLTEPQVAQALEAQNKRILRCPACDVQVNVDARPDVREVRCGRCGGLLVSPGASPRTVRVTDSSIILVGTEALPLEVQEGAKDAARRFGKYVLLGELGRGGAAVVHRAWDNYLNQYVALKFIKPVGEPGKRAHDSRILGLMHEARSSVRLRHPNIVQVYEVGKIEGEFYIAMELLEGVALSDLVRGARLEGKVSPFYDDPRRYLAIVRDVARAVQYAHTRPTPVVHCDLKPSNVIIAKSGRPFVLDFGLARELRQGPPEPEGGVRGTPAYMAPEQASGKLGEIDARTDVYGVGGILYELLAGRPPFTGDLFDVLHKAVSSIPDRPSNVVPLAAATSPRGAVVPEELERICLKCLEKTREKRYASAKELVDDLDRVIRGEAAERKATARRVKTGPMPVVAAAPRRRVSWRVAALIAGVAALFSVSISAAVMGPRSDDLRQRVDGLLASMKTEEAERVCVEAGAREWAEVGRIEADWMDQLKRRLMEAVNRDRPRVELFRAAGVEHRDADLLKATGAKLVLFVQDRAVEVAWGDVDPGSVVALARRLLEMSAADRFGLALYCMKNGRDAEARALFDGLRPTELGPYARRYLARLDAR